MHQQLIYQIRSKTHCIQKSAERINSQRKDVAAAMFDPTIADKEDDSVEEES